MSTVKCNCGYTVCEVLNSEGHIFKKLFEKQQSAMVNFTSLHCCGCGWWSLRGVWRANGAVTTLSLSNMTYAEGDKW